MKITIFANGVSNGGAEHVACNLANYFVTHGYDVDLLTMADDEPTYDINEKVRRVELLSSEERKGFLHNLLNRNRNFRRYIKEANTDCYIAFFWIAAIVLNSMRNKLGVPVITSERTNPYSYAWYYKILLKIFAPKADLNVFQTSGQRSFYGKRIEDKKCVVIPNADNSALIPNAWEKRRNIIVSAGRLDKAKDYPMLIKAFADLGKDAKDYKLVIYGEGLEREKLERQIIELGMQDKISLAGRKRNVDEYLNEAKIFALTSVFEGMPNALLEAMSLGLACVSTDCPTGGPRDLIETGTNGELISVGNSDELTSVLNRLISDEQYAKYLASNATKVRGKYSPNIIFGKWNECVKSCIEKNSSSGR